MGFIEIVESQENFDLQVGESTLNLRRFDSHTYQNIERKYTKHNRNRRTGQIDKVVDDHAVNEDLLDYMITGWSDVKSSVTGEDVPCTKENKIKLPGSVKIQVLEACDADSISAQKKTNSMILDDS